MNRNHCPEHLAQHKASRDLGSRLLAGALIELAHRCGDIHITPDRSEPGATVDAADVRLGEDGGIINGDAAELAKCILELAR